MTNPATNPVTDPVFKFDIVHDEGEADAVLAAAREAGAADAEPIRQHGMSGVEWLVIGSVALPLLVNLAMKLAELWPVGVRMDMRTGRVLKTKDPDLPRGSVLVITENGSQLHRVKEMALPDLSRAIVKLLGLDD